MALAVFQVTFGSVVFFATRYYYMQPSANGVTSETVGDTALISFGGTMQNNSTQSVAELSSVPTDNEKPADLVRRADGAFARKQYDQAAVLYRRLLEMEPDSVNIHNSLGLTLHYLGRSIEALLQLDRGVAVDPAYQRIWLTVGFVNKGVGNYDKARDALTTALVLGKDSEVGRSAAQMLASLPDPPVDTIPGKDSRRSISVSVSLSPELQAETSPEHTLFVFARRFQGPRMPLALQRLRVADLPAQVTLDESMAMTPEMTLAQVDAVAVEARISASGNAMPQSGDLIGSYSPVDPDEDQTVTIVIDRRVP